MKGKHWALIAVAISAFSTELARVHTWHDFTPPVVAGLIAAIATAVGTFMESPQAASADLPAKAGQ